MGIEARKISVKYGEKLALNQVDFKVNDGEIVTIIGPNGSGKSTLIKAISRCLKTTHGMIYLDGIPLNKIPTKGIAKKMAILPQTKSVASDIRVENLVSYGRYPHIPFGKRLMPDDWEIVEWAMEKTGLLHLRHRYVETLSGGERQRAWVAMALAQKPKILVLDEPTTYLDISYQIEVLELVKELNETMNITVIMVLHDLNQAARYSDNIYIVKDGIIYDSGNPEKIMESELLKKVFSIDSNIYEDKVNNCPYFIPYKSV